MNLSIAQCFELPEGRYEVFFDNGETLESSKRNIVLDRCFWGLFELFVDVPIVKELSIKTILKGEKFHYKRFSDTLNIIFNYICDYKNLNSYELKEPLLKKCIDVYANFYNEIVLRLGAYVSTLRGMDYVNILKHPGIIEATSNLENSPESIDKAHKEVARILMDQSESGPLFMTSQSGAGRITQINQLIGPRGLISELDRTVFGYAVMPGFIRGLYKLYELLVESRTAAKALNASSSSIRESEYTSRRFTLLGMVVAHPVSTDCGSQRYLKCTVTERYLPNLIGKWYVKEDGTLDHIRGDETHLIGETINLRHVAGCNLPSRKNRCVVCCGKLSENLRPDTNLGIEIFTYIMKDVSQGTLSFKHETKSVSSAGVFLDEQAKFYFDNKEGSELFIKNEDVTKKFNIILNRNGLTKLIDVLTTSDVDIPVSNIGEVHIVGIQSKDKKKNEVITIAREDRQANITRELLDYMREDPTNFELDNKGNYVVSLEKWKLEEPMFNIPLKDADIMGYLRELKAKIEGGGRRRLSYEEHLYSLIDLILDRSNTNFMIMEIMTYAISTQNAQDGNYRLAGTSPNIAVANRNMLFTHRSKGQLLPFEDQLTVLNKSPQVTFDSKYGESHPMDIQFLPQQVLDGLAENQ